jgi:hypothetical protein
VVSEEGKDVTATSQTPVQTATSKAASTTQPLPTALGPTTDVDVATDTGKFNVSFETTMLRLDSPQSDPDYAQKDDLAGDLVLWYHTWWVNGCDCTVSLVIQRNPTRSTSAPADEVSSFESPIGRWSAIEPMKGDIRFNGAQFTTNQLIVVIAGSNAPPDVVHSFAESVLVRAVP